MSCRCALNLNVSLLVLRMTISAAPGAEMRVGAWLKNARNAISSYPVDVDQKEIGLATQLLLAYVLKQTRAWVIAHPEAALNLAQQTELDHLFAKYLQGTPLPYLLERWEFYGLAFEVSPDVLIPRPETELLVEHALHWLRKHPGRRNAADVGTGSGAIATSLTKTMPDLRVLAVDQSWRALKIAQRNAQRHGTAAQVQFLQGNLLYAAAGPFDLVCANLPYIPASVLADLAVGQHEPRMALDGGEDGLAYIRALLEDAPRWLDTGGLLLLEMQYDQGEAIYALAVQHFPQAHILVHNDLSGRQRLVEVQI
jgi:release factor glutamine methyltransferase